MSRNVREWALRLHGVKKDDKDVVVNVKLPELITPDDARALVYLAHGKKTAADVGSFNGASSFAILSGLDEDGHLYCIDRTDRAEDGQVPQWLEPWVRDFVLRERLKKYAGRYDHLLSDSIRAASFFRDGSMDLVFIDADHRYASVKADIRAWWPKVKIGGVMAGHDCEMWLHMKSDDDLREHIDLDVVEGNHPGVLLAIRESFHGITQFASNDCTVWYVVKTSEEDLR